MYDVHFKCSFLEHRVWQKLPDGTLFPTHFRHQRDSFSLHKEVQARFALGNYFPCASALERSYQDSSILYYNRRSSYHIPGLLQERNSISQEHIAELRKQDTVVLPTRLASQLVERPRQDCIGASEPRTAWAVGDPHSRRKFCIIGEVISLLSSVPRRILQGWHMSSSNSGVKVVQYTGFESLWPSLEGN